MPSPVLPQTGKMKGIVSGVRILKCWKLSSFFLVGKLAIYHNKLEWQKLSTMCRNIMDNSIPLPSALLPYM